MPSQKPIRIGFIGLSASTVTNWAADAHLPALLSAEGRGLFTIQALCNSSVAAAERSIEHFGFPTSTKAYGSPADLADDDEIDFVICTTRVDKHKETILPSVTAGKDVYVEWPVASNSRDVEIITRAAEKSGSKVAIGLQGRWAPPVQKVKELLETGGLGQVVSSDLRVAGGPTLDHDSLGPGWEYFAQKNVGGNSINILFGHAIDQVQYVLGRYQQGTTRAHTQIQYPNVRVSNKEGQTASTIHSDVPDLLRVNGKSQAVRIRSGNLVVGHQMQGKIAEVDSGTIKPSSLIQAGATLTSSFDRAWPMPGQPTMTWTVNCEKANIRLAVHTYPSLQADAYSKPVTIEVQHFDTGSVENIDWSWTDYQSTLPVRARNTMHCLYAYARDQKDTWADVTSAAVTTAQLEAWLDGQDW